MDQHYDYNSPRPYNIGPNLLGVSYDWRYRKFFNLEELKVMDGLERLSANSLRLRKVFTVLMVLSPVLTAFFWVLAGKGIQIHRLPVTIDPDIPQYSLVLCFFVSMIPAGLIMYALYQLIKLFGFYSQGSFFARENVMAIRNLGKAIVAWVIASFVSSIVLSILLTLHREAGQRLVAVGLDSADIYALLSGVSVLTVAWVMDEARKIMEEQKLIV